MQYVWPVVDWAWFLYLYTTTDLAFLDVCSGRGFGPAFFPMPYAMLANVLPSEKMGFYMGVFNFFIVLPQILASLGLGYVLSHWLGDNAMSVIVLEAFLYYFHLFVCLFVRDES